MEIYKNFDEMRGKVKKTIVKILRKLKKKLISFKYFLKLKKKVKVTFEKILCKF